MKVTNLASGPIFFGDLFAIREAQNQGRQGEGRYWGLSLFPQYL